MASEQLSRRENTTNEREIHVEKDRVPKMTTHFEQLTVMDKEPPHGSIEALQGGEMNKDHAGKAIGDIGGRGRARETHELGSNIQSLSDQNVKQSERDRHHATATNVHGHKQGFHSPSNQNVKQSERDRHHASATNVVGHRQGAEGTKERGEGFGDIGGRGGARQGHELGSNFQSLPDRNENQSYLDRAHVRESANVAGNRGGNRVGEKEDFGGVHDVGKFQMESKGLTDDREKLDSRTKVVSGTPHVKEMNRGMGTGQVVAEKGRKTEDLGTRGEGKFGREERVPGAGNVDSMRGRTSEEQKGRARDMEEERAREKLEETRGRRVGAENEGVILGKSVAEQRGRAGAGNEGAMLGRSVAEQRERAREEEEKRSLEEIGKYRNQAQQNEMDAISAAQERYEKAKQATNETLSNTAQTTREKTAQAMEKAAQAKDATLEKTQQGYEATKDTVSSAAKTATEYATPVAEKAKSAVVQAKDVTVETGKTAAEVASKVAVDLKDKATVAGWTAAHYSTKLTVDGTKAAANVVEGAAGYVVPKAAELAAKSVDVVKGLAASAGETAKEFTAKKKDESWREYESKRASGQLQEGEEIMPLSGGIGENVSNYSQKMMPTGERTQAQGTNYQNRPSGENVSSYTHNMMPSGGRTQAQGTNYQEKGRGSNVISNIGETVGNVGEKVGETMANVGEKMKKPFENMTSSGQVQGKGSDEMMKNKPLGGSEVLGAVTETVSDIGSNMIKATDNSKVNLTQEGQGGGVLDAIGETIAEIAHTTKVIVVGEDEEEVDESRKNIVGSESHSIDRAKHEGHPASKNVF